VRSKKKENNLKLETSRGGNSIKGQKGKKAKVQRVGTRYTESKTNSRGCGGGPG